MPGTPMHIYLRNIFIMALFVLIPVWSKAETLESGSRRNPDFAGVMLDRTEKFRGDDTTQDIRLSHFNYAEDPGNILFLNFDNELPFLLKDISGNFAIRESNYIFTADSRIGRGAALFNRIGNKIVIGSPEELWPGTGPLDDFTMELWINPGYFYRNNTVFKKVGMMEGVKRGIELSIHDDRAHFSLYNMFEDGEENRHTIELRSISRIPIKEWSHIAVAYRAAEGRLLMTLNGREEGTANARGRSGVWRASFHPLDRSPLILGESYSGIIDDFRITSEFSPDAGGSALFPPVHVNAVNARSEQMTGSVVSSVLAPARGRKSAYGRLAYSADMPPGTGIDFLIRYDTKPFTVDTPEDVIPWRRIDIRTDRIPPFSYLQWKARLRGEADGRATPVLKEVKLDFAPIFAPHTPTNLRSVPELTQDRVVCLEWSKSPEGSVQQTGGYYVYYGLRPGEYLGRLDYRFGGAGPERIRHIPLPSELTRGELQESKEHPDSLNRKLHNKIRLLITNEIIERNMVQRMRDGRPVTLPLLDNNRTYYFSVSAYNEPNAPDQESAQAAEIHVDVKPKPDL